ncbi:MAG: tRNA (guanosine(46)-N7)-methyltransferase TrmB [Nitrospina sp.]|mgnify:FL=1|nr:tRNA (guanosine(46)-N7)-methyltransferase TrmB [Nitrospina sp.]
MTARPSSAKFVVEDPCFLDVDQRLGWQSQFGNNHPLKLEIGFGMGDFLIEMATREPQSNFVGIDFSQHGIRKILARIQTHQLKNIRVVHGDVREKIPLLFHDGELDTVYINFPDPWPRKRHFKRRLIKPALVKSIAQKLAPQGRVYLATDSEPYALESLEYFNAEPFFQNANPEVGFFADRDHLPKTKYEKSFIYAGDKICYLEYFRADENGGLLNREESDKLNPPEEKSMSNDELLIKKFTKAEAKAQDACDLKQVADNLAEAGDKQWAKKVYKKAEDKAEDSLDLNWLAYSICVVLDDKDWARELYKKAEDQSESSLDFNWLAYSISETLGDSDWVEKLFQKAESAPENIRELCDLAGSILEIFGDRQWGIKVYKKAEGLAEEYSDFYELAGNIYVKLDDRDWTRKLFEKAEGKAGDCSDFLGLAEHICANLEDKEWAKKVYAKAESLAEDSGDFCELAESLSKQLGDDEWAKQVCLKVESKTKDSLNLKRPIGEA